MGFALEQEGWVLSTLGQYARRSHHRGPLTTELVLRWAQLPEQADPLWWARRLAIARQFAQFWFAFDPRTQVPPPGVFGPSHRRPPVHIYTEAEIAALLAAATTLGPPQGLRVATFKTRFGLLACTGMRISEALNLRPEDFDAPSQTLLIGPCKFGPPRRIPLSASTTQALKTYNQFCQQTLCQASRPSFFCQRLQDQRQLSPATITSYRDTLRLLLRYVEQQTRRAPSQQLLEDGDAPCILCFLEPLEAQRTNSARTRNLRLTAIHAFMHFAAQQAPEVLALTARVLAIPMKRFERPLLGYLSKEEMQAILAAPSPATASGRRLRYKHGAPAGDRSRFRARRKVQNRRQAKRTPRA